MKTLKLQIRKNGYTYVQNDNGEWEYLAAGYIKALFEELFPQLKIEWEDKNDSENSNVIVKSGINETIPFDAYYWCTGWKEIKALRISLQQQIDGIAEWVKQLPEDEGEITVGIN